MIIEDRLDFQGFKIWYRIAQPASPDPAPPLLLLHGGPGGSSDIFEPLEALAEYGRTIIRFDQIGCGRSDRPRDVSLWTIASCLQQIEAVRRGLGLDDIHLLGHSWGSMLVLEYLLTRPPGIRSACLCSPVISTRLWVEEAKRLRSSMPGHIARALDRCERSQRTARPPRLGAKPAPTLTQAKIDGQARTMRRVFPVISHPLAARLAAGLSYLPPLRPAAYEILGLQFVLRHVCRLWPMPLGIFRMLAGMNSEIYQTLWGPSEFFAPGLLADWDIRPRLSEIRIPSLILSGRYDEATPRQMAILKDGLADSAHVLLEHSSHCGMWEEPEEFRAAILSFIRRTEQGRQPAQAV